MTEYLDSPFVRRSSVAIDCADKSASAPIPPGTKTLVVTNVGQCAAWVSLIGAGDGEKAVVGVGHEVRAGGRLIISNVKGATQIAAITPMRVAGAAGKVWVEFGDSDSEWRSHVPRAKRAEPAPEPKTETAAA